LTQDDALYRFRLRALALATELGNVRAACRAMGIHPSTFYRWRAQVLRFGPEILRPRERRRPKMANQTSPFIEQRVVAFSLGQPGFGPMRISAELRRTKWGGIVISPNGVHRVLRRHGLNTRAKRLGLVKIDSGDIELEGVPDVRSDPLADSIASSDLRRVLAQQVQPACRIRRGSRRTLGSLSSNASAEPERWIISDGSAISAARKFTRPP